MLSVWVGLYSFISFYTLMRLLFTLSSTQCPMMCMLNSINRSIFMMDIEHMYHVTMYSHLCDCRGRINVRNKMSMLLVMLYLAQISMLSRRCSATAPCPQDKSKEARLIINKIIMPLYTLKHYDMPNTCPLSPANDQYAAPELMKRRLGDKWMCSVCGKSFSQESDINSHVMKAHHTPTVQGCLADLCDVLRCNAFFSINNDEQACDEQNMAQLKMKCMDMVRQKCVPDYLDVTRQVQFEVMVQASICSYLSCDNYWNVPEDEASRHSHYYLIYWVLLGLLIVFLVVYFKVASYGIENSPSIEQIIASADQYERPRPAYIPPSSEDMELRHRSAFPPSSGWSEHES